MNCNYCRSGESEVVAEYARFEKHAVLQCKECGLVYLKSNNGQKATEEYYASSDYRHSPALPRQSASEHYCSRITQQDAGNQLAFITNCCVVYGKRILELGSASGALLDKLKECGAKPTGLELDREYAEFARGHGLEVVSDLLEVLGYENKFDIVVSFHTLEHVYNPRDTIKGVYVALRHGGAFLGEVPNQDDWRIGIFNDEVVKRFHYDPTHLFYFSPATLSRYLEDAGLADITLETVERYNSLLQLRNILSPADSGIEEILRRYIFPETERDETRLPDSSEFNSIFGKEVNSRLMGNCLRWTAYKRG